MGKTCLFSQFTKNQLPKSTGPTIGVEFETKNVIMKDGATVKAQLWDTSGSEKYQSITFAHFKRAFGCIIVYDITNRKTFDNVKFYLETLLDKNEQDVQIRLVGNKLDLVLDDPGKRQVSQEEARNLCTQHKDMRFVETSCISNTNVQNTFETLLHEIYSKR